ncbi:DUF2911 domain-containing protein [Marinoscillum furvescens]|uniref:DUF2911 family protein n=1 Tax=Marinoscillum furvescens DSM 4134 TaxID=1122208 RepID=A0A3D9LA93_MARFU|nr:DUF2911 domain-containing protein [Marinoscillum furvescens]REE02173.1 hypothetical protein C7460_102197 [Marinoscillum furvescens DSM 4134]
MSKFRSHYFFIFLASILLLGIGCTRKPEKRPSPPASDTLAVNDALIHIQYSSPGVKERTIWGKLVPYGEIWRTGANKATYLATNTTITLAGNTLTPGKYAIFTIPTDTTWTLIFNREWDQWGAYNYDSSKDAFRTKVIPQQGTFTERMTFSLTKNKLKFNWENLTYELPLDIQ